MKLKRYTALFLLLAFCAELSANKHGNAVLATARRSGKSGATIGGVCGAAIAGGTTFALASLAVRMADPQAYAEMMQHMDGLEQGRTHSSNLLANTALNISGGATLLGWFAGASSGRSIGWLLGAQYGLATETQEAFIAGSVAGGIVGGCSAGPQGAAVGAYIGGITTATLACIISEEESPKSTN